MSSTHPVSFLFCQNPRTCFSFFSILPNSLTREPPCQYSYVSDTRASHDAHAYKNDFFRREPLLFHRAVHPAIPYVVLFSDASPVSHASFTNCRWLYKFAAENNPNDSQAFIKALFAQRQDYGQRILAQRQSLFDIWQQTFVSDSAAKIIKEQNLEHLRDHLFSTVNLSEECLALDDPSECITRKELEVQKEKEEDGTIA